MQSAAPFQKASRDFQKRFAPFQNASPLSKNRLRLFQKAFLHPQKPPLARRDPQHCRRKGPYYSADKQRRLHTAPPRVHEGLALEQQRLRVSIEALAPRSAACCRLGEALTQFLNARAGDRTRLQLGDGFSLACCAAMPRSVLRRPHCRRSPIGVTPSSSSAVRTSNNRKGGRSG